MVTDPADGIADVSTLVRDLGDNVFMIDTRMGGQENITAAYLIRGSRPTLVETGAARSAPLLVGVLATLGIGPDELAAIVVTHVHLDHAGGVGDVATAFPGASVYVHTNGARHLVNPERLVASARRVYGNVMDEVFGDLLPTDTQRVHALADGEHVDLGDGRYLAAVDSPGHARHHLGLLDSVSGDLYVGDAAGIFIPETAEVRAATPPPDFDMAAALHSLEIFAANRPQRLLFSHYGPVSRVDEVLDLSTAELRRWVESARHALAMAPDLDHAVQLIRQADASALWRKNPGIEARAMVLNTDEANLNGIARWLSLHP